jgi:transposase InsO family protein
VIDECPYTVECAYSDNGTEYKGTSNHAFVSFLHDHKIGQKFTKVKRPQTNGKAERVGEFKNLAQLYIVVNLKRVTTIKVRDHGKKLHSNLSS